MRWPTPHGFPKKGQRRNPGPSGNELGAAVNRSLRSEASSQGSVGSTSDSNAPDGSANGRSRSTSGAEHSSLDIGPMSPSMRTLKPSHHIPTPTASDHIERRSTNTGGPSKGELNFETNKSVSLD